MKQKIIFFNVWTKNPAKGKRNEDAIVAEDNVQVQQIPRSQKHLLHPQLESSNHNLHRLHLHLR